MCRLVKKGKQHSGVWNKDPKNLEKREMEDAGLINFKKVKRKMVFFTRSMVSIQELERELERHNKHLTKATNFLGGGGGGKRFVASQGDNSAAYTEREKEGV